MPPPDDRHEPAPTFASRGVEELLEQAQLVLPPDERRLQRLRPVPAAALRDDPHRLPGRHGAAFPLSACSPAGSKAIALLAARWVASPTRTVPDAQPTGAGTPCSRGRRRPSLPDRSERDGRLAGQDARPGTQRRTELWTDSTSSSAARTASSASSSRAVGAPQTAITASPMNFSTVPP